MERVRRVTPAEFTPGHPTPGMQREEAAAADGIWTGLVHRQTAGSAADLDDLDLHLVVLDLELGHVAGPLAHELLPKGRARGDHAVEAAGLLLDGADEVALDVVLALVADCDDRAGHHD